MAKRLSAPAPTGVLPFLERLSPASPVEQIRFDLAVELLDDIRRARAADLCGP